MLQEAEERRRAFTKTLDDAVAEAERDGWISGEDALAEMDRVIDELEREHGTKAAEGKGIAARARLSPRAQAELTEAAALDLG